MPSSHGGGSSGGSHGGSFSGSGSSTHFSPTKPFPGARRYYYIDSFGVRRTFYSSIIPTKKTFIKMMAPVFCIIAFFALFLTLFVNTAIIPRRMNDACTLTEYVIDNANVIDNEDKMEELLESFYNKTGVQPVVITEPFSSYSYEYGNIYANSLFENFALDEYTSLFHDEGHWLFVYLHDKTDTTNNHWIDMAGDNTDTVITDALFDNLQDRIQSKFYNYENTFEDSFNYAFEYTIDEALTFDASRKQAAVIGGFIALFFIIAIISSTVSVVKENKMINEYCNYREKNGNGNEFVEEVNPADYSTQKDYKIDEYGNKID